MMAGQGQIRAAGLGGAIGLDMGAVLQLAAARGCDVAAMAELLPDCESGMVAGINKRSEEQG